MHGTPGCQTTCVLNSVQFKLQNSTPNKPPAGRLKIYAQGGLFVFRDAAGVVHPFGQGTVTSIGATTSDPNLLITGSPVTGSGNITFALQGISAFVRTVFDDANAAAVRSTLGLVIGTDVQPHSSDLDALVANASWVGADLTLGGKLEVTSDFKCDASLETGGNADIGGDLTALNAQFSTITIPGAGGPTITSGAGVPASAEVDGSIYLRSGALNGKLYVRENGVWQVK